MGKIEKYKAEAAEKWGNTDAYKEHSEKTKGYSDKKWNDITEGLDRVMAEFALCMKSGASPESAEAQELVKMLKDYITRNFYKCTVEILSGLGQMYVCDERFKANIDKHAEGTAQFICEATQVYFRK